MRYNLVRWTFGLFLLLIAANAIGGGIYGMIGAPDVPTTWLQSSPFTSYFIPGLILFVCIGGTYTLAGLAVLRQQQSASLRCLIAGLLLVVWIVTQVLFIGYVSWLQPTMAIVGVVTIAMSWVVRGSPA